MTSLTSRPLGSEEAPNEIFVETPVFLYGLKKGLLPPWPNVRLRVVAEDGEAALDVPLADGRAANGFLVFEVANVRPRALYDGFLVHGGGRLALFRRAELYRLAIDDPSCRALPSVPLEDDEP